MPARRSGLLLSIVAGAVLLSGCSTWPDGATEAGRVAMSRGPAAAKAMALPSFVTAAVGRFDTQRQFDAAPGELKREPAAGHPYDWLDRQHGTFRWIEAPRLGQHVMLLEWRRGGPEGSISRQRLWVFELRDGAWVMDFYTLPDSGAAARSRLGDDFRELDAGQLVGYGRDCSLVMTRDARAVTFAIPPTCSIVARSGRRMQLAASVRFQRDRILYREQGVLEGGAIAFLVPGQRGVDYEFERVGR